MEIEVKIKVENKEARASVKPGVLKDFMVKLADAGTDTETGV